MCTCSGLPAAAAQRSPLRETSQALCNQFHTSVSGVSAVVFASDAPCLLYVVGARVSAMLCSHAYSCNLFALAHAALKILNHDHRSMLLLCDC
jgi:hypothetical protein